MGGFFLMIDGPDGSGKGTGIDAIRAHCESKGKKVFDLREYWKENNMIPEASELAEYDIVISSEPTHYGIGKVIREEIIAKGERRYSGMTTAHAFSLDREILYKKLIIPLLKAGKHVMQERGVITSIVYQPVQLEKISLRDIINLPGNRLCLKNSPSLLIITKAEPETVMKRLKFREKQDNAIFEQLLFQRKIATRYESEWLKKLFENQGSRVIYLDTNEPRTKEDTQRKSVEIWEECMKNHKG